MAVESNYTGNDDETNYTIGFPFLEKTDVKVSVAGTTKNSPTDYTISGSILSFVTAPGVGAAIRIYRNTDITTARAIFSPGASVKAGDLNNVVNQLLYAVEEVGTVTANDEGLGLVAGSKGDIHVNTATDWYIKDGSVENSMLANFTLASNKLGTDCVTSEKIGDNEIDSEHYVDLSIDEQHIGNNQVTTAKIADANVTLAKIAAAAQTSLMNPVGTVIWYGGASAPTGYLKCNGDTIPNGSGTVQNISTDFSALYGVIGATIPDLRGEFIRGWDDGRGVDNSRVIRSHQTEAYKAHNHTANQVNTSQDGEHNHPFKATWRAGDEVQWTNSNKVFSGDEDSSHGTYDTSGSNLGRIVNAGDHQHTVSISINNSGGTETRPRNRALLACIKY